MVVGDDDVAVRAVGGWVPDIHKVIPHDNVDPVSTAEQVRTVTTMAVVLRPSEAASSSSRRRQAIWSWRSTGVAADARSPLAAATARAADT